MLILSRFTFVKGRWNHLGEATLMNRIKSHPDVGEKFYPQLLAQIRREQAQEAATKHAAPVVDILKQSGAKEVEAH